MFLPNFGPIGHLKYGRQAAILKNQLRAIDPKLCTYYKVGLFCSYLTWNVLILREQVGLFCYYLT
jgi:hypothetical protein